MKRYYRILLAALIAVATYTGAYNLLPRPDGNATELTTFSILYYRFFYPLRLFTNRYEKSYSGTISTIDLNDHEFILQTTPSCGIFVGFRKRDEALLDNLKAGKRITIRVENLPDRNRSGSFNRLLAVTCVE